MQASDLLSTDGNMTDSLAGTHASTITDDHSVAGASARVLSQATSTATIAARSILISGGSEATALKTAKAAAQSVLRSQFGAELGNGPKGIMRKRKIKRQAEVVSSMALISATNSVRNGSDYDLLSQTPNSGDHKRQLMHLNNYEVGSDRSWMGSSNVSRLTDSPATPSRSVLSGFSSLKSTTPRAQPSPTASIGAEMANIEEEPSIVERVLSKGVSEDDKIVRPVAIRVESQTKSTTTRASSFAASEKSEEQKQQVKRRHITSDLSQEDPIYDVSENQKQQQYDIFSESSSSDDSIEDDESRNTQYTNTTNVTNNTRQSFISRHVEPILFGFTCGAGGTACGGERDLHDDDDDGGDDDDDGGDDERALLRQSTTASATRGDALSHGSDVSSVESDELLRGLNNNSNNRDRSTRDEPDTSRNRRQKFSFRKKVAKMIRRQGKDGQNAESNSNGGNYDYRDYTSFESNHFSDTDDDEYNLADLGIEPPPSLRESRQPKATTKRNTWSRRFSNRRRRDNSDEAEISVH